MGAGKLLRSFWKSASESGRFEVDNRSRLLNVIKTPVDAAEMPADLRTLYTGLVPYEFFERDAVTGRLREFDEAFGNTALQRFHERVYDVAYDLSQVSSTWATPESRGKREPQIPKSSSWPRPLRTLNRSATSCAGN